MNLNRFENKKDLWSYLTQANKTIVMYGMGNGADKILNVCQKYNIEIDYEDGKYSIRVNDNEKVTTLDGVERTLSKDNLKPLPQPIFKTLNIL